MTRDVRPSWIQSLGYRLFLGIVFCLSPFSKKLRLGIAGRIGLRRRIRAVRAQWQADPVWFHVASSGELEQCLPLLDRWRERFDAIPVFVSVFSPSGRRALELEQRRRLAAGLKVPWDYADYSPLDLARSVCAFCEELRPRCFVAIHREIWPGILHECRRRQIPTLLLAAYFAPKNRRLFAIYRPLLRLFSFVGTVEPESASFLRAQLPEIRVEAVGDPRIERVLARKRSRVDSPWVELLQERPVFIAASIWEADFRNLKPALRQLLEQHSDWRLVLVPHEPESALLPQLERWFARHDQPVARWSRWVNNPEPRSHLIVDTVGLLAELYAAADLVFVGGSFRARVHNVLEPAAYGRPILTGPCIHNSREALEMASERRALFVASTGEELASIVNTLVTDTGRRELSAKAALEYLEKRTGAAATYLERMAAALRPVRST